MKLPNAVAWVLVFYLTASAARGAELLANGGFEELRTSDLLAGLERRTREFYGGVRQSPFQGWGFGGKWEGGDYSIAVSDDAHSGKHSCRITCGKKGRGGIASSPLRLKAGTDHPRVVLDEGPGRRGRADLPELRGLARRRLEPQGSQDRAASAGRTSASGRLCPAARPAASRRSSFSFIPPARARCGWTISRSRRSMSTPWPRPPTNRPPARGCPSRSPSRRIRSATGSTSSRRWRRCFAKTTSRRQPLLKRRFPRPATSTSRSRWCSKRPGGR